MPSLKEYNEFGQLVCTVEQLLTPVSLTGVSTTSGSSTVTVASTTGLYAGMILRCPNFALPCLIHAVRSSTTIDVVASAFSASGVWTTSAANAQASATASGLLATALPFDPQAIIAVPYAMGAWRNIHSKSSNISPPFSSSAAIISAMTPLPGAGIVPSTITITAGGTAIVSTAAVRTSDDLDAIPLKRHNGEFWGFYYAVSHGGQISKIPAIPTNRLVYVA